MEELRAQFRLSPAEKRRRDNAKDPHAKAFSAYLRDGETASSEVRGVLARYNAGVGPVSYTHLDVYKRQKLVWYFDTCAGVVKSYDVCGNGKMLLKHDAKYDFTNLELLDDEIWSKTVLGAVTLEDTIFSPATTRQSLHRSNPGPSSPARLGDRAT